MEGEATAVVLVLVDAVEEQALVGGGSAGIWKRFYEQTTLMGASPATIASTKRPMGARFYRPQRTTATATRLLACPHGKKEEEEKKEDKREK